VASVGFISIFLIPRVRIFNLFNVLSTNGSFSAASLLRYATAFGLSSSRGGSFSSLPFRPFIIDWSVRNVHPSEVTFLLPKVRDYLLQSFAGIRLTFPRCKCSISSCYIEVLVEVALFVKCSRSLSGMESRTRSARTRVTAFSFHLSGIHFLDDGQ
jgi:hypothetical protein